MHINKKYSSYNIFLVVTICFIIYISILFIYLSQHNFQISSLIHIEDKFCAKEYVPDNINIHKNTGGYDGQFYYWLAIDPFLNTPDIIQSFDLPSYRAQRILYPLIVWLLSLNNQYLIPYFLVIVNFTALCLISYFAAKYFVSFGQSPFWGLILCFYPGFLFSFLYDLPEPIEILFLLLVFYNLRLNRHKTATLMLSLAVLTRETALLVAVVFIFIWILQKIRKKRTPIQWYCGIIPFLCYLLWQSYIYIKTGNFGFIQGKGNIGFPFIGLKETFIRLLPPFEKLLDVFEIGLIFGIIMLISTVLFYCRSKNVLKYERYNLILYALALISFTSFIWIYPGGYLRALSELYLLCFIILVSLKVRLRLFIFGYWILMFIGSIIWLLDIRF